MNLLLTLKMKNTNLVESQKNLEVVIEDAEPPSQQQINNYTESFIEERTGLRKSSDKIGFSKHSLEFYSQHFPGSNPTDWCSWQWQIRNSITTTSQLEKLIHLTDEEVKPSEKKNDKLPLRITPYYASLIAGRIRSQAIRKSVVPTFYEMIASEGEASDPLLEGT